MLSKSPTKLLKKGKTRFLVTEPAPPPECIWAQPGKKCWASVPLTQCFFKAKILSRNEDTKQVTLAFEQNESELNPFKTLPFSKILESEEETGDVGPEGYEDMVNMNCLNEAELVYNLKLRYKLDIIYSYIGPTLLFVNPYKPVPLVYNAGILDSYYSLVEIPVWASKEKPHVYAVSAKATHKLLQQGKNQAIVISGESGAGKTENTKYALKFLTYLSSKAANPNPKGSQVSIEDKIMSSNPILEAFGNAKTIRNDNSSRFGKYMRIKFNKETKQIQGVEIKNYLLEKSRVTSQTKEERNYHIFYQLMRSGDLPRMKSLGLVDSQGNPLQIEDFNYIKNSDKEDIYEDAALYQKVCQSFEDISLDGMEKDSVWAYVGAVLLLGNLEFDDTNYKKNEGIKPCEIKNEQYVDLICRLLGLDKASFLKSLLFKRTEVQRQIMETSIGKNECETLRNTLSKRLYERLFIWLTKRINMEKQDQGYITIGLLDIFGFEKFGVNSLEQLCINYTNEKLHQLYIEYVFKSEKLELMEQGLTQQANNLIIPKDNIDVITLIEKVFNPIDESAANNKFAMANLTDKTSLTKLIQENAKNTMFKPNNKKPDCFIIFHTADEVEYTITGFKSKNQDFFPKDFEDVLLNTKTEEVRNIYLNLTKDDMKKKAVSNNDSKFTLLQKFKLEMKELMDVLIQCEVHFIRCLKPNIKKSKDNYQGDYILQQINYLGVLESIKIRKEGFPFRKEYKRFLLDYSGLSVNSKLTNKVNATNDRDELRKMTWNLMRNIILNEKDFFQKILYGRNKINLKQDLATHLDKLLLDKNRKILIAARVMMKQYRIYTAKKAWKENTELIRDAFLMISKMYKGYACRKRFLLKKKRAVTVQSLVRMRIARKIFRMKKQSMKKLTQTFMHNRKKMLIDKLHSNNVFFKTWRTLDQRITIRGFFKRYYKQVQLKKAFLAEKKAKEQVHAVKLMNKILETKILVNLMARMRKEILIYRRFKKACVRLKSFRIGFMMHCFLSMKMNCANIIKKVSNKPLVVEKKAPEKPKPSIQDQNIAKIQNFYKKKMAKAKLNRIIVRNTSLRMHHANDSSIMNRIIRLFKEKRLKFAFRTLIDAYEADLKADVSQETMILSIPEIESRLFGKLDLKNLKKMVFQPNIKRNISKKIIKSHLYECFFLSKNPEREFLGVPFSNDVKSIPELPEVDTKSMDVRRLSFWDQIFKKDPDEKPEDENDKKNLKKIRTILKNFKETKVESKQWICVYDIVREGFAGGPKIKEEIFHQIYTNLSENKHPESYITLLSVVACCFKINQKYYYIFMKKLYDLYSKNPKNDNGSLGYCSKAVQRSFENDEKTALLGKEELWNVWRMKQSRIMIKINRDLCFFYFIENYCTVKLLLDILIQDLQIEDIAKHLGLYLDFNGVDYFLSDEKFVLYEINRLSEETGGTMIPNIYLRIKLANNRAMADDDDYLILRYAAVFDNFLNGKCDVTMEEIGELASLAFLVEKGRYTGDEMLKMSEFCPKNKIPPEKKIELATIISEKYRDKSEYGFTRKSAMVSFLNILERFEKVPVFDCNYGVLKVDKYGKIVSEEFYYDVKLTIKEKNITLTRIKDQKEVVESIFYKKIKLFGDVHEGKKFAFRTLGIYDEIHVFENIRAFEIKGMVEGYIDLMAF